MRQCDKLAWNRVSNVRIPATGQARLSGTHRRKFVLSGLLQCAVRGGGYTVMAKDRYGCAMHVKAGTLSNGSTITRGALKRRVLDALRGKMITPDAMAEFILAYSAEVGKRKPTPTFRRGLGLSRLRAVLGEAVRDGRERVLL